MLPIMIRAMPVRRSKERLCDRITEDQNEPYEELDKERRD